MDYRDYYDTHTTVLNGIAEIGFDSGPVDTNIFQVMPIVKYPIYVLVKEDSIFGKYDRLPVECLHEANVTLHDKCSNNADFFNACRKLGVCPKVSAIVGRELTVYHGVQIAPFDLIGVINIECAEAITVEGTKPMPIDHPDFYEQINMFWKRGEPLSETGQKLIEFFGEEISALPDEERLS